MCKYIFIASIIVVTILSSCNKQDSITSPQNTEAKFVVDSIGTTVSVKTDSISMKLQTYLTFAVVYHYVNYSGSLDYISLGIKNSYALSTFIDYISPESPNIIYRFKTTFQFKDSLYNKDSVLILRNLSGTFVTKDTGNTYKYVNSFLWKDSVYVRVER
jgi:hypothetical protein